MASDAAIGVRQPAKQFMFMDLVQADWRNHNMYRAVLEMGLQERCVCYRVATVIQVRLLIKADMTGL